MSTDTRLTWMNIDIMNICLLTIGWVVMVILVNPLGDFPLNDDWAYGWSVKTLLESGDFRLSDWTAVNLLSQVIWGALFCLPFGFSFTALRLSTLTLGLIGVIITYLLLREVKTSPKMSLMGAIIIALNPIYFGLSYSFMSDVPSFTFTLTSLYFLTRALTRGSRFDLSVGVIFSFISILNRQSSLIVLPAFGLAYLIKKGVHLRHTLEALFPSILGLAVYLSYSQWLEITGRTPHSYNSQTELLMESFSTDLLNIVSTYSGNIVRVALYLGLFLLPFLILNYSVEFKIRSIWKQKATRVPMLLILAIVAICAAKYQRLPSVGNVLDIAGVGPSAISGSASAAYSSSVLIRRVWQVMTVVGVAGAALLFRSFLSATLKVFDQKGDLRLKCLSALTIAAIWLFFIPIGALPKGYWFDRYLLVFLPLLMILVSISTTICIGKGIASWAGCLCLIMLLFYGGFSISATHDYLSWNRVHWQAISDLVQGSQISPEEVNGGFEFRGWNFGNRLRICNPGYQESAKKTSITWNDFTCLWNEGNEKYMLSLVTYSGYQIVKRYSFRSWLPLREENLYVLRKDTIND